MGRCLYSFVKYFLLIKSAICVKGSQKNGLYMKLKFIEKFLAINIGIICLIKGFTIGLCLLILAEVIFAKKSII
jgi:hypothetical protein